MAGEHDGVDSAVPSNIFKLAEAQQKKSTEKETVSQALVRIGSECELFHDDAQVPYMSAIVDGRRETWFLKSLQARGYLSRCLNKKNGRVPGGQALQDALNVLAGKAIIEGPMKQTVVRIGHFDDKIYIDLADAGRNIIEVSNGSWTTVQDAPVRFRRPQGMTALPLPVRGGSLDELRQFINVGTEDEWRLVVTWLVATYSKGPYAWLVLLGRQGTAKSSTSRILRTLIDPNKAPIRGPPKLIRDLAISASNSAVMAYDNISFLDGEMQDAICRLSTGGGFVTRMLHTDTDEIILQVTRPGILNGITDIASRGDLLERSVPIELQVLKPGKRKTERELNADFEAAWPRIFGALLDAIAGAFNILPSVQLANPPRMADFACIGVAVERHLKWPAGSFMAAYGKAMAAATDAAAETSTVFTYVKRLSELGGFKGTPTDLYERLNEMFDGVWPPSANTAARPPSRRQRPKDWPKSPQGLSGQLRRLEPTFEERGIVCRRDKTAGSDSKKLVVIEAAPGSAPPLASLASHGPSEVFKATAPTFFPMPAPAASPAASSATAAAAPTAPSGTGVLP